MKFSTNTENIGLEEDIQNFEDWMRKGGTDTSKIKLKAISENQRGLFAKCNIKKDETVLFIPYKQILTFNSIKTSPLCQ